MSNKKVVRFAEGTKEQEGRSGRSETEDDYGEELEPCEAPDAGEDGSDEEDLFADREMGMLPEEKKKKTKKKKHKNKKRDKAKKNKHRKHDAEKRKPDESRSSRSSSSSSTKSSESKSRKRKFGEIRDRYNKSFSDIKRRTTEEGKLSAARKRANTLLQKKLDNRMLPVTLARSRLLEFTSELAAKSGPVSQRDRETLQLYRDEVVRACQLTGTLVDTMTDQLRDHLQSEDECMRRLADFAKELNDLRRTFLEETIELFPPSSSTTRSSPASVASLARRYGTTPSHVLIGSRSMAMRGLRCTECHALRSGGENLTLVDCLRVYHPYVEPDQALKRPPGGLIESPMRLHFEEKRRHEVQQIEQQIERPGTKGGADGKKKKKAAKKKKF